MASEMLYPVMPIYLKYAGYSVIFIGLLEGFAEALAGLSKSYFGRWSDLSGRRLPFVRAGYLLSAISKPMLAIFIYPFWIFLSRTIDRIGKGLRTGPRDAMLSDQSLPKTKGRIFGFHRSLDTFGAVIGPALALLFLYYHPNQFKTLFLIAFIPGIIAVLLTFFLKDKTKDVIILKKRKVSLFAFVQYWKVSPLLYRKLVIGLLIFALFNSSDIFLLLKMKENGLSDTAVIGVYIFYNLVYALMSYPAGKLADKIGLKNVFIFGLFIFTIVYIGFAFNNSFYIFILLFVLYGFYAAATESIAKAWISNIVDKNDTATAIGTYSGFQSICTFLASLLCGVLWAWKGATFAFLLTASSSLFVIIFMIIVMKKSNN